MAYNGGYTPQLFSPHGSATHGVGGQRRGSDRRSSLPAASLAAGPQCGATGGLVGGFPGSVQGPQVYLSNADIWRCFSCHGTEMIITKQGRLMFPPLEIHVTGLEADKLYTCLVDFVPLTSNPWKYVNNRWKQLNPPFQMAAEEDHGYPPPFIKLPGLDVSFPVVDGKVDGLHLKDCAYNRLFVHHDSPSTGQQWMNPQGVAFNKLKLTNNKDNPHNLVVLKSMHMYQPRIHVLEVAADRTRIERAVVSVTFPETRFVCVTSYQNSDVTELKVRLNKYARGSRSESLQNTSVFNKTVMDNGPCQSPVPCHSAADFGRHGVNHQPCCMGARANPHVATFVSAVLPPAFATSLSPVQHPITSSPMGPFHGFYPATMMGSAQPSHAATHPDVVRRRGIGCLPARVQLSPHLAQAGAGPMSVSHPACQPPSGLPAAVPPLASAADAHCSAFFPQPFPLPLDVAGGILGARKRRSMSPVPCPELARAPYDQRLPAQNGALPAKRICVGEPSAQGTNFQRIFGSSKKPEATVSMACATSIKLDQCMLANTGMPSQPLLQQQELTGAASSSWEGNLPSKSDSSMNPVLPGVPLAGSVEQEVSASAAALFSILDDFQPVSEQFQHSQSFEDFGDEFLGLLQAMPSVVT